MHMINTKRKIKTVKITEKRLRGIIRNIILENEEQLEPDVRVDKKVVDDAIKIILGENRINEDASKLLMASFGVKMSGPLLASLVIGYAHMKGVPVESLAAGATEMASEITRFLGIKDQAVIMHMINVIWGLTGASITYSNVKGYLEDES